MRHNKARSFWHLISSPAFSRSDKGSATIYKRVSAYLGTDSEDIISAFLGQCRIDLKEIEFDVSNSNLSDEAKSHYLSVVKRFSGLFSQNHPWQNLNDPNLKEFNDTFLMLSEQVSIFNFSLEDADRDDLQGRLDEAKEIVSQSSLKPEHENRIKQALAGLEVFLNRTDVSSYEVAWKELSSLMTYLFREAARESDGEKRSVLKRLAMWSVAAIGALGLLAGTVEDVQKITDGVHEAYAAIEHVIESPPMDQGGDEEADTSEGQIGGP